MLVLKLLEHVVVSLLTEELSISGSLSELKVRQNELHDSVHGIVEQKFEKFSIN